MSGIARRLGRDRQPQAFTALNENVAKDAPIIYCPPFGATGNQVSARYGTVRGDPTAITRIPTLVGVGEGNAGGLTDADYAGRYWTGITLAAQYTVLAAFYDRTGRGTIRSLVTADNDWAIRSFQFRVESSNSVGFIPFNTGGIPFVWASSNTTSSTGLNVAIARLGPGGVGSIALNGVSTSPGTLIGTPHTTPDQVSVGQYSGNIADNAFKDAILVAGIINRWLTDDEVRFYTDNPLELFEPEQIYVPFASGATDYPVTATDALTLADSASQTFAATGVATDALTLADSASNVAALGAVASDALTLADSASNVAALSATATDALTLADTLNATASGDYTATISEALTLADSASNVAALGATGTDALTLADAASNVAALGAAASDALTLADTLNASASGDYVVVATDALSLSDSVVAAYAAICIATDALTLADATSAAMAGEYAATATDALTLADAVSNAAALGVSISEALTLAALVSAMLTGNTALTGTRGGYGVQMQLAARRAQIQTGTRRN